MLGAVSFTASEDAEEGKHVEPEENPPLSIPCMSGRALDRALEGKARCC